MKTTRHAPRVNPPPTNVLTPPRPGVMKFPRNPPVAASNLCTVFPASVVMKSESPRNSSTRGLTIAGMNGPMFAPVTPLYRITRLLL